MGETITVQRQLPLEDMGDRVKPRGGASGLAHGWSRDEMNLAEFPLTVLSTRVDPKVKTLEFSDLQRRKNGEVVERKWIITGADKFGLPTATDDDVILGLIRLTMDQGFRERKLYFTRYELLRTLRWSTEGRSYSRLTKALDRLSGVRIRATNSFYDNSSKTYQTRNFGIIDAYEINDHRAAKSTRPHEQPKSFFIWSEVLFDSFRAGFIKKLDLELYFSLRSAVSRRLYRYLDKHFYYKSYLEKPLMSFAFEKLGLSRNYKFVSSLRQQIEPAADELVKIGFLGSYEIAGRGEQALIRFKASNGGVPATAVTAAVAVTPQFTVAAVPTERPVDETVSLNQLIEALVSRGLTLVQARRLLERMSAEDRRLVDRIVRYYDYLVERRDPKISRSKIGFLYCAVEAPSRFTVPASFETVGSGGSGEVGEKQDSRRTPRPELRPLGRNINGGRNAGGEEGQEQLRAKQQYADFLDAAVADGLASMAAEEVETVYSQVERKMECLKSALKPERFKDALDRGVREELVKMLRLPDLKAWTAIKPGNKRDARDFRR